MAVEKMKMMQLVGKLDRLEDMVRAVFNSASIEMVDALTSIEQYSFTIDTGKENLKKTLDMNQVSSFEKEEVWQDLWTDWHEVIGERPEASFSQRLKDNLGQKFLEADNGAASDSIMDKDEAQKLFSYFREKHEEEEKLNQDLDRLKMERRAIKLFSLKDIEIADLSDLENFSYAFGTLTEAGRRTIKGNYENIPAAVIHLGQEEGEEAYLMIYPKRISAEIQRLKDSLNWKDLSMPETSNYSNEERLSQIESEIGSIGAKIDRLSYKLEEEKREKRDLIRGLYACIINERAIEEAKTYMARGNRYFYMAAWVPERQVSSLERTLAPYDGSLVKFLSDDEIGANPPTKLHNIGIFRPFEALINMYGTPNYRELDPTPFFAITYMILFGAMFGDLGQGAVFALAGLVLKKKRHPNLGGVVLRIGLSSMIFGILYGSVFGNEDLIPAIMIKPFNNINTVLLAAIGFGVVLSSFSYVMGIINRLKSGDIEEGLFGKEGITGFVLYLSLIGAVLSGLHYLPLPTGLFMGTIGLSLVLILFKQPITNALKKKSKLYEDDPASYYVESGFSLIEALISVFSGLVSFIRVGAFAINHVGLFMAFETMGNMMGGSGKIAMLVIGNIVILGLEGLIVFIQSLRLEYYEMFSKYYTGDGHPFRQTNA